MRRKQHIVLGACVVFVLAALSAPAADLDEFKVKRKDVFEFAEKPRVTRDGDKVTITFAAKDFCDATVALENIDGKIVRHIASGVLGPNAPPPFQKNSLAQTIVWDGKDDKGTYIDDKDALTVRVSLGLWPQFERSLLWTPKRRPADAPPLFAPAPEGVYVWQGGQSIDSVILYDRNGQYVRTVYPFPGNKVEETKGLQWRVFPQDGARLPLKTNFLRCTMLTSGNNAGTSYHDHRQRNWDSPLANVQAHWAMYGGAAQAMARSGNRLALAFLYLNRLSTDGATGGLDLLGPKITLPFKPERGETHTVAPWSAALSPDGKTLYLTSYTFGNTQKATQDLARLADVRTLPVVMKLDYETNAAPVVFKGSTSINDVGADNERFKVPAAVACDAQGRVYVADHMNDRVQVFTPDGKHVKTIPATRPAQVAIHERTGDIYIFSWLVRNQYEEKGIPRQLFVHGPLPEAKKKASFELAPGAANVTWSWGSMHPIDMVAAVDSWSDPVRIWLSQPWSAQNVLNMNRPQPGIQIKEIQGDKLVTIADFAQDCRNAGVPNCVAPYYRQRLYVNPATGLLYVAEGDNAAVGKSFREMFEIDPKTGRHRVVQTPFNAEDMCFDLEGHAYFRSINTVARYSFETMREVPWDYGEEWTRVGYGWMSGMRTANLVAGLTIPADANWHHGGMHVSPKGNLLVACGYGVSLQVLTAAKYVHVGKKYQPLLFPGRLLGGRCGATTLHVWNRHGQLVAEDIAPGQTDLYGVGLDASDNLYLMTSAPRLVPGPTPKPYPDPTAGSLVKFPAGKGRVLTKGSGGGIPTPLPESMYLDRPTDSAGGNQGLAWFVDAEWVYGGVGFSGGNIGGCSCWNARFSLDYLARSFAPEVHRYSVAVLDSAGNVIVRIGRYGNVDEGKPLVPAGSPKSPREIGGDEVALFHAPYLATHTDRRLFIADPGNGRILSVKLGYHAEEKVALKDVAEGRK